MNDPLTPSLTLYWSDPFTAENKDFWMRTYNKSASKRATTAICSGCLWKLFKSENKPSDMPARWDTLQACMWKSLWQGTEDEEVQGAATQTDRQVEGVTAQWCWASGTNEEADLLAGQVIYTMYEVTVSSIDAVRFLWVVAAPCMTYTWRRVGGSHWDKHTERASWLRTQYLIVTLINLPPPSQISQICAFCCLFREEIKVKIQKWIILRLSVIQVKVAAAEICSPLLTHPLGER